MACFIQSKQLCLVSEKVELFSFPRKTAITLTADQEEMVRKVLSRSDLIDTLVRSYLGPLELLSALESLDDHIDDRQKYRLNGRFKESDFLVNEWGLTGVCLAYSLTCVSWVEKYGHEKELPLLMAGRPDEMIRHLQKMLILALYQSLRKGMDPEKVCRLPAFKETINAIFVAYNKLQYRRTAIEMRQTYPGPSFFESQPMAQAVACLEDLYSKGLTEKDHFIFLMNPSKECPICMWHVIYVNPALGVIGDAAIGLLWKIDATAKNFFFDALKAFVQKNYYDGRMTSMIHLTKGARPGCQMPLFLSRVGRRAQTAFNVARVQGAFDGFRYLAAINRYNPLVLYFFPDTAKAVKEIERVSLNFDFEELAGCIEKNLDAVSKFSKAQREYTTFLVRRKDLLNPEKCKQFLASLRKIHTLGPKAHALSLFIHYCLIKGFSENLRLEEYPPHILNEFIPALLEIRDKTKGEKYCLTNLLEICKGITFNDVKHQPFFDLLVKFGADPKSK